jgi:hypothetical protein
MLIQTIRGHQSFLKKAILNMSRGLLLILALLLSSIIQSSANSDSEIYLICRGIGTSPEISTDSIVISDLNGNMTTGTATRTRNVSQANTVRIKIVGNTGEIQLPPELIPPVNMGGHDGWWELKKLKKTEELITAKFSLNIINNPKVTIDRYTGEISFKGLKRSFNGKCNPIQQDEIDTLF